MIFFCSGTVTLIAGSSRGYRDGLCDVAQFMSPVAVAVDPVTNDIYVVDHDANNLRKISFKEHQEHDHHCFVSTVETTLHDGSTLNSPHGVAIDRREKLPLRIYIADTNNNRIIVLSPHPEHEHHEEHHEHEEEKLRVSVYAHTGRHHHFLPTALSVSKRNGDLFIAFHHDDRVGFVPCMS